MAFIEPEKQTQLSGKVYFFSKWKHDWIEMKDVTEETVQEFVNLNYRIKDQYGTELIY